MKGFKGILFKTLAVALLPASVSVNSSISKSAHLPQQITEQVANSFSNKDHYRTLRLAIEQQLSQTYQLINHEQQRATHHRSSANVSHGNGWATSKQAEWQALKQAWVASQQKAKRTAVAAHTDRDNSFNQLVLARFNTLENALATISQARTATDKKAALAKAKTLLEGYLESPEDSPGTFDNQLVDFSPFAEQPVIATPPASASSEPLTQCYQAGEESRKAEDLGESYEVQLTDEIKQLAKSLDYSPIKILEYVTNTIDFDLDLYSVKGAEATLLSKRGGATDQASLLIALLRASNIPSRYVKGRIVLDHFREGHPYWYKSIHSVEAASLAQTFGNTVYSLGNGKYELSHVWVEACLPYGNYRGTGNDNSGMRWLALDSSFKHYELTPAKTDHHYQFDYTDYLSKPNQLSPREVLEQGVVSSLRASDPNATWEDVVNRWHRKPLKLEYLPNSLPYRVQSYSKWKDTESSSIAAIPDYYRLKAKLRLNNKTLTTINLQEFAKGRVTLSFKGANAASEQKLQQWRAGTAPLRCTDNVQVQPVLKASGKPIALTNTPTLSFCSGQRINRPRLDVHVDYLGKTADKTTIDSINTLDYYALQAYPHHASHEVIAQRVDQLLKRVQSQSNPAQDIDGLLGDFLDIALIKYINNVEQDGRRIAELHQVNYAPGFHVGSTRSLSTIKYLFDLPYAINSDDFVVDVPGMRSDHMVQDMSKGSDDTRLDEEDILRQRKVFHLAATTGSWHEHNLWQEVIHREAVSTVRGLQLASSLEGNTLVKLTADNIDSLYSLVNFCKNLNTREDCYFEYLKFNGVPLDQAFRSILKDNKNKNAEIYISKKPINYESFKGFTFAVYTKNYGAFPIGPFSGGITVRPRDNWNNFTYDNTSNSGYRGRIVDSRTINNSGNYGSSTPTTTIKVPVLEKGGTTTGIGKNNQVAGDPVNMVSGNMYHHETDFSLPARGIPVIFKRTYNSHIREDGPLGIGWTHSFNHYLSFADLNQSGRIDTIIWTDGTNAKKYIKIPAASIGGNGVIQLAQGQADIPDGEYFTLTRQAGTQQNQFILKEKTGLTYYFDSVPGKQSDRANLLAIQDRVGNKLTLNYQQGKLISVTDPDKRNINFTYTAENRIQQVTDWAGAKYQYHYDAAGHLADYVDPVNDQQAATVYQYYTANDGPNHAHAMKSFRYANGYQMTFEYYADGKTFRHYNSLGEEGVFTYNPFRREASFTDERGFTEKYFFNDYGLTIKTVDKNGGIHQYQYNDPNDPTLRTQYINPMGYITQYQYDQEGHLLKSIQPSGAVTEYAQFNVFGQPGLVKQVDGSYLLSLFDQQGNVTEVVALKASAQSLVNSTAFNAAAPDAYVPHILSWTRNTYNANGTLQTTRRVRHFSQPDSGPYSVYHYDDAAHGVTGAYPTQVQHFGDMNDDGQIAADESYGPFTLTYNQRGQVIKGLDSQFYPLESRYNQAGQLVDKQDRLGNWWQYSYDASGLPLTTTLLKTNNGTPQIISQSAKQYDAANRLIATYNHAGATVHYQHDKGGNVTQVTDADGYSASMEYDPAGRLVRAFDEKGQLLKRDVDLVNRLKSQTFHDGQTIRYEYYGPEQNGLLKREIRPNYEASLPARTTQYEYNVRGQVVRIVDPAGRETLTTYDDLGRVARVVSPSYSDSVLGSVRPVTHYQYDNLGNQTAVYAGHTNAAGDALADQVKLQMQYVYDDFGRVLRKTDAAGNTWHYQYDEHSNVITSTDPKQQITTFSYYPSGLLKSVLAKGADGKDVTAIYQYNTLGLVTQVQSDHVTYDFTYDDQHRLETVTDSRAKKWLKYAYTLGGQLIETRDSDQNQLQYAYDAVGRLVGMKAPNQAVIKFSYNTQDQLAYKHYANGTHTAYQYNADGSLKLLETFSNTSGQEKLLNQHAYKYDNEGLVVGVKQKTAQGKQVNRQYKYDGLGRLTEIRNDSTLLEKLSYDPYGNRRQHQIGGQTYYYQQNDLHQVTAIHQGSQEGPLAYQFSYDVNGNLVEKVEGDTTLSLVYDALDQLVQANKSGLPAEHYQYDHSGNRIQKQVGDQVTQYLYNGSQVHATYSGSGNPTGYFLYSGLDQPEMFLLGDNVQYYHADALGSITTLTDAQGKTSASQVYNSWGAVNSKLSSGSIPLYGYTGREPDATGLIYYRARYYDPDTARFTQLDPKGFIDGVNRYTYALNSPMMFIDPWGTSAMKGANGVGFWGRALAFGTGVMSSAEAATGAALCSGLITCLVGGPLMAHGLDNAYADFNTAITGRRTESLTTSGLRSLGVGNPELANDALGFGLGAGGAKAVANQLASSIGGVATKTITNSAGSIRNVNKVGGKQNCVNCAIATDATIAGRPASALNTNGPQSITVLEKHFGAKFSSAMSKSRMENSILKAGDGARGIVLGSRGSQTGHVFNVVNQKGTVRFLDGQTGKAASFEGFQSFHLLRTN